jgi:hypothetical protein
VAADETLAALAAQLDELRAKVDQAQAAVRQWDARLEREGIGATLVLRAEVKRLADRLTEAVSKNRLAPPDAPWWLGLPRDEEETQLAELKDFVDRFARAQYPGYFDRLPSCWANHREAVWELSNLKTEWVRVYGDPDQGRDLAGALWWHERWLPGALARLRDVIRCDASGCRRMPQPWGRSPPRQP